MIKTTHKELIESAELIRSVCSSRGTRCVGCLFHTSYGCMLSGVNPENWDSNINIEEVTFIDE